MRKSTLGNLVAIMAGIIVAAATMALSYYRLKQPQIPLDWVALAFTGLITGLLAFFIVWGHFQKDPTPDKNEQS